MITDLEDDILFVPPEERRAVCAEGVRPMAEEGIDDINLQEQEI